MVPPLDQLTSGTQIPILRAADSFVAMRVIDRICHCLDGYDLQFGTNVLGHAHLTLCLLPALLAGAKSSSDGKARVINTASNAATLIDKIDFDTIRDGPKRQKLGRVNLYHQSKLVSTDYNNLPARRRYLRRLTRCLRCSGKRRLFQRAR